MTDPALTPLEALAASLCERVAAGEPAIAYVEDLRRFILARLAQQVTQSDIENEMIGWGVDPRYAVELTGSTRMAGKFGEVEVYTAFVGGGTAEVHHNPTYKPKVRAAERATQRMKEARRLVDGEPPPDELAPELGELQSIGLRTPAAQHADRRRVLVAVAIAVAVVGAVAVWVLR